MTDIFELRFLLASLHIEAILRGNTVARRRKTLKSIKDGEGLGDAYGATLERIKAQDEEKAKLAVATLTWVCHAERPLQVDELCNALAVEIGIADFDPENVPSIETLRDCCQGLITVDAKASTVRLIHSTVQEYLCSHPGLFTGPHLVLAGTCLTYLNSPQVKNQASHSLLPSQSMPFLKYSARYWGAHTNRDISDNLRDLALKLLNHYEHHISALSLLDQALLPYDIGDVATSPRFSGLRCASFFGIVELVTVLINVEGCVVDQRDCVGRTPLAWAAINGQEEVVKVLLERKNVDPNHPNKNDRTPLACAALNGHERVVNLLLEREDVDPNRPGKDGGGPLGYAAYAGHEGVVGLFLKRENVDPNLPDKHDTTPLGFAANNGHEGVVKLLLERENVDPNRPDNQDLTPLGGAAISGNEGVITLLLQRDDVDPNRPDVYGRTPLQNATITGHEGVVKLLTGWKYLNPNSPNEYGRAPLTSAPIRGQEGVAWSSLEQEDVDPNLPDEDHLTLLTNSAIEGQEVVATLSLEMKNSNPNHPDSDDTIGYLLNPQILPI